MRAIQLDLRDSPPVPQRSKSTKNMSVADYRLLMSIPNEEKGRSSKYNAIKTEVDGITFDSRGEAKRYAELKILENLGEISELRLQQSYDLVINEVLICKYRSDFEYKIEDGSIVVEDFKGFRTPEYKIKRNLMKAILGIQILETGTKKSPAKKNNNKKGGSDGLRTRR